MISRWMAWLRPGVVAESPSESEPSADNEAGRPPRIKDMVEYKRAAQLMMDAGWLLDYPSMMILTPPDMLICNHCGGRKIEKKCLTCGSENIGLEMMAA